MSPDTPGTSGSDTLEMAIARSGGLDTLLRDLTDRAVRAVPGAAASSVTVRRGDRLLTMAGSSGLANGLDQRQYENGSGPCVDAAETGLEQYAPDLAAEKRWPHYTSYARSVGVRCVLALPLSVHGEQDAALNFYGVEPGVLGVGRQAARAFAAQAADAINISLHVERERDSVADVGTALLSRSIIDQAIGILMAQERINAATAMKLLRRASQNANMKLRDLCTELVTRTANG